MKAKFAAILAACLTVARASGVSPASVAISLGPEEKAEIPADFIGLSFETSQILPDKGGKYFFSAQNSEVVGLFRKMGIKSLRIGGATADISRYKIPGPKAIDELFAFAEAADVKIIYTLRLHNGSLSNAVATAKYIEEHYAARLDCFALGNEPDWPAYHTKDPAIKDYPSFLADWRKFAEAITNAAPGARFEGPCTGSNYPDREARNTRYHWKTWTRNFARDEKGSGLLAFVSQHDYPGQDAKKTTDPAIAVNKMLSPDWVKGYQTLYDSFVPETLKDGERYRLEEVNNFSGGVKGASDSFAAALWALDFLHWWAAHGALGVNFHNRRWIPNDVIRPLDGGYGMNPIGYGIMAFDLGARGAVVPVQIAHAEKINLTAYAVRGPESLFLTVINKEHGVAGRAVSVKMKMDGAGDRVEFVRLTAPGRITSEESNWNGGVIVPPESALILKFPRGKSP